MKIIIFSDLHYVPEDFYINCPYKNRKLSNLAIPLLEKIIDKVNNQIKPDLVINLGDLIEDIKNKPIDLTNLKFVCGKFKDFIPPTYTLVGNHDMRSMDSRKEIAEALGYKNLSFSFNKDGYHFVMLGLDVDNKDRASNETSRTHFVPEEDLKWLENDLNENELPTLIFVHFGVAEDEMKNNWWFSKRNESALLANRNKLKQIIKNHKNILAVFSGHQHWTKTIIEDNLPYFVVGSLTENINDDGVPDGVFVEVNLKGKSISVQENHLKI